VNIGCGLQKSGSNKTLVTVPQSQGFCATDLKVGSSTFHEHFVSYPPGVCLGWLVCAPLAAP
jgi:hypothetical protein